MVRLKQVILIRKDLKMRRGKEIAQGSHAAMAFLTEPLRQQLNALSKVNASFILRPQEKAWLLAGNAKVCLRVNSEAELLEYHHQAQHAGLVSYLITDSGRTEFNGVPTHTACAIGPDENERIDRITGNLIPY